MKIKTDKELDVAYIQLKKGKVTNTVEVRPGVFIDLDKTGEVIGIEILSLTKTAPLLKANQKASKKVA